MRCVPSADAREARERKRRHLAVCGDTSASIERRASHFQEVRLIHHPFPEMAWESVDTTTDFCGSRLALPFFISCMAGGSPSGARANRNFARAAQHAGIPVGLGSIRILLRMPEVLDHFHMKSLAPDVPVWANLGAAQLREIKYVELAEWLKRLEVQALALHCNAGQELFQPQGDRDFCGIVDHIRRFCDLATVPVMVKETGFGLRPQDITTLIDAGVCAVDIAGCGGTNWILVEAQCQRTGAASAAGDFSDWGNPTPIVLASLDHVGVPVLASGGIRNGVDIAKSIALGASLAGLARPFIQAEEKGGCEGVMQCIETLAYSLKTAMLLTGSRTIRDLSTAGLILSENFLSQMRQYQNGGRWRDLH